MVPRLLQKLVLTSLKLLHGELIIPASSSSVVNSGGTISITTYGDGTIEPDETFTVTLSLPSDANAVFPCSPDNDPARFATIDGNRYYP